MPARSLFLASGLVICLSLQACAAALVPVAIGGVAARSRHKGHMAPSSAPLADPAPDVSATSRPPASKSVAEADLRTIDPVPNDAAAMVPGKVYRLAPQPGVPTAGAAPAGSALAAPSPADLDADETVTGRDRGKALSGWSDVSRYVAGQLAAAGGDSVLLVPGSTVQSPRWVPCEAKPPAMLIDLDALVSPAGKVSRDAARVVDAMRTLGVGATYLARRPEAEVQRAVAAMAAAGLDRPQAGVTLMTVVPGQDAAARARIGARYCVVAIAGSRPEDFPNSATPDAGGGRWNKGWFQLPVAQ